MKFQRQSKILELIETYEIETQDELAQKLCEEGFNVTQATVSRDIREMKLTKIATEKEENAPEKIEVTKDCFTEKEVVTFNLIYLF